MWSRTDKHTETRSSQYSASLSGVEQKIKVVTPWLHHWSKPWSDRRMTQLARSASRSVSLPPTPTRARCSVLRNRRRAAMWNHGYLYRQPCVKLHAPSAVISCCCRWRADTQRGRCLAAYKSPLSTSGGRLADHTRPSSTPSVGATSCSKWRCAGTDFSYQFPPISMTSFPFPSET